MDVYRSIMMGLFVMVLACLYVYQHVEIVKQGYVIHEKRKDLAELVDQNSALMYNLSKLESPKNLLSSVEKKGMRFEEFSS